MMAKMTWQKISRLVRGHLGVRRLGTRLVVVDGFGEPEYQGDRYQWRTPGGRVVRYCHAYRIAFGKPVYVPSTRRVQVGAGWLIARAMTGLRDDAPAYVVRDRLMELDLVR